jgi:RNA polymerase sigma factor (sigma-70 family)
MELQQSTKIEDAIERWRPYIWGIVIRHMFVPPYTREDQEDVTQSVIIRFFIKIQKDEDILKDQALLENEDHIRNWLIIVTQNLIRNQGKRAFRSSEISFDSANIDLLKSSNSDNFNKILIDEAIKQLLPEEQYVLRLILQGHTLEEISKRTNLTVDQVRYRITKSKSKLSQSLAITTT